MASIGYVLCLVLALTAACACVHAQVSAECEDLFRNTVTDLYADDISCNTALSALTDDTIETTCTSTMKSEIRTCVDKHSSQWTSFTTECETLRVSTAPITAPAQAPEATPAPALTPESGPATSPSEVESSTVSMETEDLEEASAPSSISSSPSESSTVAEQSVSELDIDDLDGSESAPETEPTPEPEEAPAPSSSRRFNRRLLEDTEDTIFEESMYGISRSLLETTTDMSCYELLTTSGISAFTHEDTSTTNSANGLQLPLLSIIGSILLGMMLI